MPDCTGPGGATVTRGPAVGSIGAWKAFATSDLAALEEARSSLTAAEGDEGIDGATIWGSAVGVVGAMGEVVTGWAGVSACILGVGGTVWE